VTERLEHEAQLKDRQGLLEQANTQLEALAVTDGLTGLFNHRAFQERLEGEVEANVEPLSLILIDVDLFKTYNDSFGHPEGDRVLRQVAALLQASVENCGIAARYGGEEFAIILPGYDASSATAFGNKLCQTVAEAPWPNRSVTISAGIATLGGALNDPASLIQASDEALYASKHAGRNRSTHSDSLSNFTRRAA
jgi:diguanylate cyclase (GGDEF)-like protein